MSELKVEIVKIKDVQKHPNADRLDLVFVEAWQCVTQKDKYKIGDDVIYIPIDSILPEKLDVHLFPPDSKIKLDKHRVKTIKIRGAISQGIILNIEDLIANNFLKKRRYKVGDSVAEKLGITKYEPPVKMSPQSNVNQVKKRYINPWFKKYTNIENFKWYPELFVDDDVVILEKIHGSNHRCGVLPFHPKNYFDKVKMFFRMTPKYEFVYGSHNVQIKHNKNYKGFYEKNVYYEVVEKYNLEKLIDDNVCVYGEVYGDGIQPNYRYDCGVGERKLVVFDVMKDGRYLNHEDVVTFCNEKSLPHAPILYTGKCPDKDTLMQLSTGPSVLHPKQEVREGIVIKPLEEQVCYMGRKILKLKSDAFLLNFEDNTH